MHLPETGKGRLLSLPDKALRIMRMTAFFLLVATLHVSARTIAQKISLNENNAPLVKVFGDIETSSGYSIVYDNLLVQKVRPVTISVTEMPVRTVLNLVLQGQGLDFMIFGKVIFIRQKTAVEEVQSVFPVRGTVRSATGEPLEGASVTISGNDLLRGVATDRKGQFAFTGIPKGIYKLAVTMVGYGKYQRTVDVGESTGELSIALTAASGNLNDMVVVAYGSTKKKDLTGSVSTISAKDIQDIPFTTVDNALAGKAAGVQVTKSDGTPGGAVRVRVRGSTSLLGGNDPLYVIDGVPVQVQNNYISPGYDVRSPVGNAVSGTGFVDAGLSTAYVNGVNSLTGLNPDDIESITILKDASSTAIYGSKAANGVVIITTKKGRKDMTPQITVNEYTTVTSPKHPKVLDAQQYRTLLTEAAQNDFDYRKASSQSIPAQLNVILNQPGTFFGKANTNWVDQITRSPVAQNAEVAIQGGSSASRYYSSVAYTSTPGTVKGSDYQRISGKLSLDNEIGKHFRLESNINLGYVTQNITNGVYDQALKARPDFAPYDSTGNWTSFAGVGQSNLGLVNPLAELSAINKARTFSLLGSISAIVNILPGLQFKSTASLNMQNYTQRTYTPSYLNPTSFYGDGSVTGGIGSSANSQLNNWFIENTLTYDKTFNNKHSLNVLAGTSYETRKSSFFSATGSGYPNDNVLNNLSSAATPLLTQGNDPTSPQSYLISYYLRANYGYLDKYLLTFTGRTDGSSKFGPDNKYGYFPSGAVAWRMSKENFLKRVSWLDDLKLRASYGLTGTQNIGDQMYRTLYTPLAYAGSSALVPTQLGNAAIKWETTKEADGGLDFALFQGRLQGTFDYYRKQTDGALLSIPVAPSSAYSSLLNNSVNLRNSGYELALAGDIMKTSDFRWNMSVNITWARSLVTKINRDANLGQIANATGLEVNNTAIVEGKPLGLFTGYRVTGIIRNDQQLADYKAKLNLFAGSYPYLAVGDPMFQLDTVTYAAYQSDYPQYNALIGSAAPNYFGGLTEGFSYKNFDLNLYFTFSEGGHLLWGDDATSLEFSGTSNANQTMLGRWTPQDVDSKRPRLLLNDESILNTNLSIYSSSYIKLRTATLTYRLNNGAWMKRAGIRGVSIYGSATNIFTITKYPGNDPETSDDPYSVTGGYFDVSNYPSVRTYSLGIKASF